MKFETQKDRPLIPAGEHVLKFIGIDSRELPNNYKKTPTDADVVTKYIWKFLSQETDDDGVNYEYSVWTGNYYGGKKAAMTALVDMLSPGMTVEKFADFDTDDIVGKKYRALIKHEKKEDGSGMKASHVYIAPVVSKLTGTKAADPKPADELDDPFADEDDFKKAA